MKLKKKSKEKSRLPALKPLSTKWVTQYIVASALARDRRLNLRNTYGQLNAFDWSN